MVKTFSRLITQVNRTVRSNKKNEWIVIHYVGAESTAQNNCKYFEKENRQASAHYFVDEKSIWQCVEDKDEAWHVGAKKYYNSCRNSNSIGIELCCKKDGNGNWYFEKETVKNAQWLTKLLMDKYNIPVERVCRHYDVTHKICPEPYVKNLEAWREFIKGVTNMEDLTYDQKCERIKEYYGLDDKTINFFKCYIYNVPLIDKLYAKTKNGLE